MDLVAQLVDLSPADLAEVMRIERIPAYAGFIGNFTREEHEAELVSPAAHYLGWRDGAGLTGFVILQEFDEPAVHLRRIAVGEVERGAGSALLRAAMDWVETQAGAEALTLHVKRENGRARRVYQREGFADTRQTESSYVMALTRGEWEALPRRAGA